MSPTPEGEARGGAGEAERGARARGLLSLYYAPLLYSFSYHSTYDYVRLTVRLWVSGGGVCVSAW